MKNVISVVLAAGQSKRIKSGLQKVMHEVAGKPIIKHVIETLEAVPVTHNIVVINKKGTKTKDVLKRHKTVKFVFQNEQLGTGHAVMQAKKNLAAFRGLTLVVCGDTPLITPETLRGLLNKHISHNAEATILTTDMEDPFSYGRIIHNMDGTVQRIVEEKDALPEHKAIKEINTGTYCFNNKCLFEALGKVTNKNRQGEYYLTDVIEILTREGHVIEAYKTPDPDEAIGINTRRQLAQAHHILRYRILNRFMDNGVTIMDADNTFIDSEVKIDIDTVVYPFTFIRGKTVIGKGCQIGPQSEIKDTQIGNNSKVLMAVVSGSSIGSNVIISPFSHINNNTIIKDRANIGTGTITSNFKGKKEDKIIIEEEVLVGANTNILAPAKIGKKAVITPGSLVTGNVPARSVYPPAKKK
jgi:bifunctional UDP-N-acetylglucosamine pyrophosphorylase / glucosamine-1-phosphate N-acetyltransferase